MRAGNSSLRGEYVPWWSYAWQRSKRGARSLQALALQQVSFSVKFGNELSNVPRRIVPLPCARNRFLQLSPESGTQFAHTVQWKSGFIGVGEGRY
jgi:hypothetical protein